MPRVYLTKREDFATMNDAYGEFRHRRYHRRRIPQPHNGIHRPPAGGDVGRDRCGRHCLTGVAQRGSEPVHGQQDATFDEFGIVTRPQPAQQLHLHLVQRLEIREAVVDRLRQ